MTNKALHFILIAAHIVNICGVMFQMKLERDRMVIVSPYVAKAPTKVPFHDAGYKYNVIYNPENNSKGKLATKMHLA